LKEGVFSTNRSSTCNDFSRMQIRKIFEWDGLMGGGKADGGANNVHGRMIGLRQCK
jgi:hypothetical protein